MNDFEKALSDLKELILTKFEELEKQQNLRDENNRLRMEAIESKNSEQDIKINALEKNQMNDKGSTWEKIKNAIINWVIPFICVGVIYYVSHKQ